MAETLFMNGGNSESQDDTAFSRLFAQTGVLAAPGVLGGLAVAQNTTADGNVLIAAGSCVLHPTMAAFSLLMNDTTKTLNVLGPNPMGGTARNDIVAFDSITATILAITGTPSGTPADPAVPNTSLALARLRHAASATTIPTAKIDQLQQPTSLRGAPVVVASQAARDTLPLVDGLAVYRTDTHRSETYTNTVWVPKPLTAFGSVTATTSGGLGQITFSHGLPWTPTNVQLTSVGDNPATLVSVTSTQVTVQLRRFDTGAVLLSTSVTFMWAAFA